MLGGGPKPAWMSRVPTPVLRAPERTSASSSSSEASQLAELVAFISQPEIADDAGKLLSPLTELRKLLSVSSRPPIQQVLDLGGLQPVCALLRSESAAVQLQAAWILTNITSGSSAHAAAVLESDALAAVYAAMQSPAIPDRSDLCSQLLWILGNIAGDTDSSIRDKLLEAEVVGHIGQLFAQIPGFSWDTHGRTEVLRTLTWLMSSLCGGSPAPKLDEVDCAFDYFAQVVTGTDDAQMSSEALWGLHHLLAGAPTEEDAIARALRMLSAGFGEGETAPPNVPHPVMAQVAGSLGTRGARGSATVSPATKILGFLTKTGHPQVLEMVCSAGAPKALGGVLSDSSCGDDLRLEAAAALANIASSQQVQKLLDESAIFKALASSVERAPSIQVRQACCLAVANLAKHGAPVLARRDCKEVLRLLSVSLTSATDAALQQALLDSLDAVLCYAAEQAPLKALKGLSEKPLSETAEAIGLVDTLEELQHAEAEDVYRKAVSLLERFFGANAENRPPQSGACPMQVCKSPLPNSHIMSNSPMTSIMDGSPARPGYRFGA